jgi:hypothetical protein
MYPAVVSGALAQRRKLRLCKEHFDGFWDQLNVHAILASDHPAGLVAPLCYLCGLDANHTTSTLYVTAYNVVADREDWWAPLHDNCVPGTVADWLMDTVTAS